VLMGHLVRGRIPAEHRNPLNRVTRLLSIGAHTDKSPADGKGMSYLAAIGADRLVHQGGIGMYLPGEAADRQQGRYSDRPVTSIGMN
jgi:hypothetical protein